ncbi:MAG: hypothetical protein K2X82_05295 [Gemmataceae bacterium]|nr:hypothetical protein [Gemmataceae bacterium]
MPALHLATFACDVTPPLGHPLCGGWIEPVRAVDDPLKCLGVLLLGAGKPVVLCAVDWCGLRNQAFRTWRAALADAAHTTPEHVSLHCVHPHNAPFADTEAQKLIAAAGAPPSLDLPFYNDCVKQSADALRASLMKAKRFTHVGHGAGTVEQVASNRRVLGPDGTVKHVRYSSTKDPAVRAEPEGLIDPLLRTLSFWDGDTPLTALHFYACHPMSYYGDGRVTPDFCGLARQKRQDDDPAVFQVYFNGAGGNITPGKYNDGAKENRPVLRDRVYAGMTAAWKDTKRSAVAGWEWRTEGVELPPRREASFGAEASRALLDDPKATAVRRINAALQLAWLKRADTPIEVNCLDFGRVAGLFLPAEAFVEYQLAAQKLRPGDVVCVAAYGDDGPGYIPTARAFLEGGYEPTVALAGPDSEEILLQAIRRMLVPGKGAKK